MQPTPYTPTTDFSQQEAANASGRSTVNTAALDAELANIEQTLDETLANLELVQRDDGKLADLTVQIHTISPEVLNLMGGFRLTGLWAAATAYAEKDIATNGDYTYVCHTAHTSGGSFDGQYWTQFGFSGGGDAQQAAIDAQNSANAAATSATASAASATTASGHATTATTQATNAAASATTATTQANNASTSATNAANSAATASAAAANLPNASTAGANKFLKTDSGGTAWEYQTAAQARASLGATTVGGAVFTAADAASGRTALEAVGYADLPADNNVLAPHRGLVIKWVSNSTASVAATAVVLTAAGGAVKKFSSLSVTLNIAASGAAGLDTGAEANSTWYHVWGIGKTDGTVSAVFSTSTSAPTLPSGYTYYGYLGAMYNNSAGDFIAMLQRGPVALASPGEQALTNGTQTSYTAVSLAAQVPTTATAARLRVEVNSSSGTNVVQVNVAPTGSGGGAGTYGSLSTFGSYGTTGTPLSDIRCEIETAQQIVYRVGGTNARANIDVQGWVF